MIFGLTNKNIYDILTTMNQIILDTLGEFQDSQINLASLTARQILANKLEENLEQYVTNLVEEAVSVIEGLSK